MENVKMDRSVDMDFKKQLIFSIQIAIDLQKGFLASEVSKV